MTASSSLVGLIAVAVTVSATAGRVRGTAAVARDAAATGVRVVPVAGNGVDLNNSAIVHSEIKTATGTTRRSTAVVELNGDLHGKVLYQVTSVIDPSRGTLVNTGDQVYSGTIAGSEPVMIHDNRFRFEANLATGVEHGSVYLSNPIAGPKVHCRLQVQGTGHDADGNPTFSYVGKCTFLASP